MIDKDKKSDKDMAHEEALERFGLSSEAEMHNREMALDDLRFARLGEQWPQDIIGKRKLESRPCMTFNRMPTFIRQVVNDGRQNKPAIKVHPADDAADPQTADVINGIIRNIEYTSNSDVAYDTGLDFAASCGFGYWRVDLKYAHDDSFEMDLCIERVANPFSVYGDHTSTAADASDWNYAFLVDSIPKEEFEAKYGKGKDIDWESDQYAAMGDDWRVGENVVVAEYWTRDEIDKVIVRLSDGRTVDEKWLNQVVPDSGDIFGVEMTNADLLAQQGIQEVARRDTKSYKVKQHIMNGVEILETNDWPGKYIPIVPVYGEELNVEGKRYFRSLIRDAKDAQRNFNYWRTTSTELVALAPKAPFIGAVGQFDTDADKWARANTDALPFIEYDPVQGAMGAPQRQPFAGVPAGALQEALNASDDMKSIIGLYDASIGARSNETSGRAINARRAEGDTSTFHFIDNQARAIRYTGLLLIDLIPHVYSKPRMMRIMGTDKQAQTVPVNQPLNNGQVAEDGTAQIYNLTVGKYDLTVDTGPSFQTRREEAAYGMTELIRAYPPSAAVIAPKLAKAQDWPDAEDVAAELEKLSPTAGQNNPQVQQMQMQMQQMQQQMQQMGQQLQQEQQKAQALAMDKQLEAQKLEIDMFNAQTNRMKAVKEGEPVQQVNEISQNDIGEAEKMQFDAELQIKLKQMDIDGRMELEILRQQNNTTDIEIAVE